MTKIVVIALICAIIITYLKSINSELTILALIGSGIVVLYFSIEYIVLTSDFIFNLISLAKIDNDLFKIIYKVLAISYLVEFGAGIIDDFGIKSLSDKLIFVGKLLILATSMPIIYAVFNLLVGLMQ